MDRRPMDEQIYSYEFMWEKMMRIYMRKLRDEFMLEYHIAYSHAKVMMRIHIQMHMGARRRGAPRRSCRTPSG